MGKVKLVVCDNDLAYLSSFVRHVRLSEYGDKFTIKSFSAANLYRQFIDSGEQADILLVAPELVVGSEAEAACGMLLLLADNDRMQNFAGRPAIAKYRPLHQLLAELLGMVQEQLNAQTANKPGQGKFVAVYSPSGGSGKTTVAFNLARSMARKSMQVSYLNMEFHHAVPVTMHVLPSGEPTELIYHLKERNLQLEQIIARRKHKHPEFGFDVIVPPDHADEWLEADEDDLRRLFAAISGSAACDLLVADVDGAFHTALLAALHTADCIIWLLTPDPQAVWKTERMLHHLSRANSELEPGVFSKIRFVLNRSRGDDFSSATLNWNTERKPLYDCILPEMERAPGAAVSGGEPIAFLDSDLRGLLQSVQQKLEE